MMRGIVKTEEPVSMACATAQVITWEVTAKQVEQSIF